MHRQIEPLKDSRVFFFFIVLNYHVNLMVLLKPLILPCNILNDDIMLYLFILEALVIHLIPLWSSFMHYFFGASRHCPLGLEIPLKIILTYLFCGLTNNSNLSKYACVLLFYFSLVSVDINLSTFTSNPLCQIFSN